MIVLGEFYVTPVYTMCIEYKNIIPSIHMHVVHYNTPCSIHM